MAFYSIPHDPMNNPAAAMGEGVGQGLTQALEKIIGRKSNVAGFQAAGMDPQQANALAGMDNPQMLGQLLMMLRQGQQMKAKGIIPGATSQNKQMARILKNRSAPAISRKIKEYIRKGKGVPANLKKQLKNRGFTDDDFNVMFSGSAMTPEIAKYFIRVADGDEFKAKKLARKYGFNVPLENY